MPQPVPQFILDELTNVAMPSGIAGHIPQSSFTIGDMRLPVHQAEAVVLGSGAAGLRAAIELKRRQVDVVVATQTLFGGTSACSGSDKQTLHTASTSRGGDDFLKLAQALGAGGAMDRDTAYVEAVGSIEAVFGLKYLGLPLPEDRYGAVLRYQTDHDEAGRATSCGPRTSRLMVKVLAAEAIRLGIPFVSGCTGLKLLKGCNKAAGVTGLLAVRAEERSAENPYGLLLFQSPAVVLATGGPGELYRDSVYPRHCYGSLGMALDAGVELVNLTESQFGIGTPRDGFPWNLSGTYVQAIPYIYSAGPDGQEHNFLADYYRTTQEVASNIFRKGYQWPFHASRMRDFGSSLVDLAIFRESQAGRTVYMDFNRNPETVPGDQPFSLDRLDPEVRAYLGNNGALQASPIERLRTMNPLAIELYKGSKMDIAQQPLAFTVNNQHMNGGVAVDIWGQSSLPGCYAVGEVAGTHGVTRPGGAALNAGQVFGIRCAKHIHARQETRACRSSGEGWTDQIQPLIDRIQLGLGNPNGLRIQDVRQDIQARMSDKAGFICRTDEITRALDEAATLNESLRATRLNLPSTGHIADALLCEQLALASEAVLQALHHYVVQGGGSRGARVLCSPAGTEAPVTRHGPMEEYRFLPERETDRQRQIRVRYEGGRFKVYDTPLRSLENLDEIYFEKNWAPFLTGEIYS